MQADKENCIELESIKILKRDLDWPCNNYKRVITYI